jgi:hypothetical protein
MSPPRFAYFVMGYILSPNDPAELWAGGPSVRADCYRARISARGNDSDTLKASGNTIPYITASMTRLYMRRVSLSIYFSGQSR